jgi:hypothetical protein
MYMLKQTIPADQQQEQHYRIINQEEVGAASFAPAQAITSNKESLSRQSATERNSPSETHLRNMPVTNHLQTS